MKPDSQVAFAKYRSSIEQFSNRLNVDDKFSSKIIGAMATSTEEFESMFVTPRLQESEILRIAAITDYYLEIRSHYSESISCLKEVLGIEPDDLKESVTESAATPNFRRPR